MLKWNVEELACQQLQDSHCVELLPVFSATLRTDAQAFEAASRSCDMVEVLHLCHRIRGSAAVFGFGRFAAAVKNVEDRLRAGDLDPQAVSAGLLAVSDGIELLARRRPSA